MQVSCIYATSIDMLLPQSYHPAPAYHKEDAVSKLCQRPPVRDRRLVVTSGLHRNSAYLCRRAALASRSEASGMVDKYPVLIQSCRARSVLSVTFLAPTRSACSVYPHFGFWHTKSNPLRGRFASSVCPHIGHAFEV